MKIVNISLAILLALSATNCKKKQTDTPATPEKKEEAAKQEVTAPQDEAAVAKEKIGSVLTRYYADLEKEQINEADYFAPQLVQFFKKTNFAREDVGKAIRTGFNSVENRKISFDANNVQIVATQEGYVADFEVNASFTRSSDKKAMNEKLKNRVMFDKEFKIISYANAEETGTEGTAENFAKALSYSVGSETALASFVHPEKGISLVYRNGAIDDVKHYATFAELMKEHSYMKNAWAKAHIELKTKKIPKNMGCEEVENLPKQEGWFDTAENFQGITNMMRELKKVKETNRDFSSRSIENQKKQEALVTHQLLSTDLHTVFYFGQIEGKWYLLAIDKSKFSCEA
ncbi:MAG: hypothetical protein ACKVTZ_15890 [Bacteroidia bacterium]